jgi:hypothetical protein
MTPADEKTPVACSLCGWFRLAAVLGLALVLALWLGERFGG